MVLDVPAVVQKRYTVVPLSTDFIPSLGQPKANILWIGCSDSWITETSSLDVLPDETFVHRNLGAVVSNDDLSSQSAIAYSVELLKVKHIVICGHYDCGLIKEDEGPDALHGWCRDLSMLHAANETYILDHDKSMVEEERNRHLTELFTLAEAEWLKKQSIVIKAMQERDLKVHAFVFDKKANMCVRLVE